MTVKKIRILKRPFSSLVKKMASKRIYFFLFLLIFPFYLIVKNHDNKILNNTFFGNNDLGGLNVFESQVIINQALNEYANRNATFVLGDLIIEARVKDLGILYDPAVTSSGLYVFGRPENIFTDLFQFFMSFFKRTKVQPYYSIDAAKFNDFINSKFNSLEKPAENAKFSDESGKIVIINSKGGEIIDRSKIISDLASRINSLSEVPIDVETVSVYPNINTSEINSISDKYKALLKKNIVLLWGYDSWKIEGASLSKMLTIRPTGSFEGSFILGEDGHFISFKNVAFINSNNSGVEIAVENQELDKFLIDVSKFVNRPTINATAKFDGVRVTDFTPAVDGQKLDINETKAQIISFLSSNNANNKPDVTIKLPVLVTTAKVENEMINSLGIKELIGKGVSYFAGSIPNRIFNIELGAKRVNGILVGPGEVFSFNNAVGEVSGKTGYKQAYVISSGRTVLDDGGGICQVSTTIFRAALNSGLPIISRTAHAYRVGYYEQRGFGPGLDATVFAPSVDFKFKNDTSNYILVQTVFSRGNSMLEVDVYGTGDARSVEVSKPVILSRTPAPPEIRQDDPSLPKGTSKQVDFAAEGADVYFKRKVFQNGGILYDDTFKSKFKPWQAVFLVGTGG